MNILYQLEFTKPVHCYNGAYDSDSQRVLDQQDIVMAAIRKLEPEAHATYFPQEGEWMIHVWGRPLSGYFKTKGAALYYAHRDMYANHDSRRLT